MHGKHDHAKTDGGRYDSASAEGRQAIQELWGRTYHAGAWRVAYNGYAAVAVKAGSLVIVHEAGHEMPSEVKAANAEFIAVAHDALPAALREIERLESVAKARVEGAEAATRQREAL